MLNVPAIIRNLPFLPTACTVTVPANGEEVRIKSNQIMLWVTLAEMQEDSLPANSKRFPALFDPGCNQSFLIQVRHLREWAQLDPADLCPVGMIETYGKDEPIYACNVWLHRNKPGTRDLSPRRPFCVELDKGIIVTHNKIDAPRLPLFGLRAVRSGKLDVTIRGLESDVSIEAPDPS